VPLRSFEETLVLLGAAGAWIACGLFGASGLASFIAGLVVALVVGYVTYFEFTLGDGVITFRTRFMERSISLEWVESASVRTFWGGLPGRTYYFLLRSPPAPWAGYFRRTGLVTWPSAERWVQSVNAAAEAPNKAASVDEIQTETRPR
jgi:hypothetical protein